MTVDPEVHPHFFEVVQEVPDTVDPTNKYHLQTYANQEACSQAGVKDGEEVNSSLKAEREATAEG